MTQENKRFSDYYAVHKDRKPSPLLKTAIGFVAESENKKALELGAGVPVDALFLSENKFSVTAVDITEESKEMFETLNDQNIKFIFSSFADIDYPENTYDIISAQRALPFINKKETLLELINKIKKSLKVGGVFTGQLFGTNDEWCTQGKEMSFVNKEEFEDLFKDMKIVHKSETEKDSTTANGNPKHWHIFDIVAVKK